LPDAALSDAAPPDAWTPTPEDPAALRIASWNLEDFPKNGATLETVAALIEEHQLDLVGVQEITEPEPFEGLAALLPDHEMFVSFDPWGYTRVGFLYRTSLIEVGEVERIFTSERDAFPRDPLVAEIRVKGDAGETRFDFTLAVVHLKAQIDDESRLRRVAAVELLDGWVRERMLADPDVIIIGDFNDELTDPPEWNVFGPFLGDPETYRFLTLEAEERGAHSYIPFRAMIDHILVTTDVLSEYGRGVTEVLPLDRDMASYQTVVSDHLPVVASFELPPM
jgi:endonuclease/exonuclease/phosphatase family metal-dependent hydrolase